MIRPLKSVLISLIVLLISSSVFALDDMHSESTKPNIIILLADDLGYGELGSYGQEQIRTPNLDRMAEEGMRFTDFYAGNTVCAPARASLMTGKDPGHVSIRGNSRVGKHDLWLRPYLSQDEITIGEMLKKEGYQTALIGKWHLESPSDKSTWVHNRGFDKTLHFQWGESHGDKNYSDFIWVNGVRKQKEEIYRADEYVCLDEFFTNHGMEFLEGNRDQPFFLMMSYKIPHTPESDLHDDSIYADKGWPETERRHAGRITHLDHQVGRLMDKLASLGLEEETLIFFTSDNGTHKEGGHDYQFFNSSGPFRGHKRDLYEGGIRVPMIARWEGTIKPGQVSDHPAAFWDLMPTIADAVGIEPPGSINGLSFMPELLNRDQRRHDYLYWEFQLDGWWQELPNGGFRQAVRMGKWKGVRYGVNQATELYNLEQNPGETNDLSGRYPGLIDVINHLFQTAREPTPGFPYGGKDQLYKAQNRVK